MLKKIVIIGPESTGKSTLSQQLATHYNTLWCPEYAREYLLKNGMNYTYEDLLTIAKGQIELEEEHILMTNDRWPVTGQRLTNNDQLLFIDTNMYVMKVWCEFVFEKCHRYILDQIEKRQYNLYLLCNIDLPWIKDELREYPELELRQKLYKIYKDIMTSQPVPWVEISGNYEERLQKSIQSIDQLLY